MLYTTDYQEVKRYLSIMMHSHSQLPVLIWGPPGIGKSAIIKQLTSHSHVINFATLSSKEDLFGVMPATTAKGNNTQSFYPMKTYVETVEDALDNPNETVILFMDEINRNEFTLAAAMGMITDRILGDMKLPDNVKIMSAANNNGNIIALDSASKTRYKEMMFTPTLESWFKSYGSHLQSDLLKKSLTNLIDITSLDLFEEYMDSQSETNARAYFSGRQLADLDADLYSLKDKNEVDIVFLLSSIADVYGGQLIKHIIRNLSRPVYQIYMGIDSYKQSPDINTAKIDDWMKVNDIDLINQMIDVIPMGEASRSSLHLLAKSIASSLD